MPNDIYTSSVIPCPPWCTLKDTDHYRCDGEVACFTLAANAVSLHICAVDEESIEVRLDLENLELQRRDGSAIEADLIATPDEMRLLAAELVRFAETAEAEFASAPLSRRASELLRFEEITQAEFPSEPLTKRIALS